MTATILAVLGGGALAGAVAGRILAAMGRAEGEKGAQPRSRRRAAKAIERSAPQES